MRTAPSVTNRADTAVAVQGITTWLPPDVDSAEPGQFDVNSADARRAAPATDPGVRTSSASSGRRRSQTSRPPYVANYRFVVNGAVGRDRARSRATASSSLGAPQTLTMTAKLSTTLPIVTPDDFDGDGKTDKVTIEVVTLVRRAGLDRGRDQEPERDAAARHHATTTTSARPATTTTSTTTTTRLPPTCRPTPTRCTITVNDSVADHLHARRQPIPRAAH